MELFRRRYTTIEDDLNLVPPILGKIRLGLKVQKIKADKSTVEYPTETDYFVCPAEVVAVYGDKPTALPILFLSDTIEDVAQRYLAWYGSSKGLKCHGNKKEAHRLDPQSGDWVQRDCPCEQLRTDENPRGECTENCTILFMLPEVSPGGLYQLTTKSFFSSRALLSALVYNQKLLEGHLAGVPMMLIRERRDTHHDQKKQVHYTLNLKFIGTMQDVMRYRNMGKTVPQELPPPMIEEGPAADAPDVTVHEGNAEEEAAYPETGEVAQQTLIQPEPSAKPTFTGPKLPPYGQYAGRPMDDPAIPIDALKKYLKAKTLEAKAPNRESFRTDDQKAVAALTAEITKRKEGTSHAGDAVAHGTGGAKPTAKPMSTGPTDGELRVPIQLLKATEKGEQILERINRNFRLKDGELPTTDETRLLYLESLWEGTDQAKA